MDLSALIFAAHKSARTANERLDNLPDFMKPCGTIGADGDLPDLPSDPTVGDVYFVATDGTYDGHVARIGDMFYFNSNDAWSYVPTGDVDTWRNIFVNGVEIQGITNKDPLKLLAGDNIKLEVIDGEIKISFNGTMPVPTVYGLRDISRGCSRLHTLLYGLCERQVRVGILAECVLHA